MIVKALKSQFKIKDSNYFPFSSDNDNDDNDDKKQCKLPTTVALNDRIEMTVRKIRIEQVKNSHEFCDGYQLGIILKNE